MADECPICLIPLYEPADLCHGPMPQCGAHLENANACRTSCGHQFHKYCLFKHMDNSRNGCPICCHPLHRKRIYPVYPTTSYHPESSNSANNETSLENRGDLSNANNDGDVTEAVPAQNTIPPSSPAPAEFSGSDKCPLCSDFHRNVPAIPWNDSMPTVGKHIIVRRKVNTCCTACGHKFHKYSLFKSFETGLLSQVTSPTCHRQIFRHRIYPLYLGGLPNRASKRKGEDNPATEEAKKANTSQETLEPSSNNSVNTAPPSPPENTNRDFWLDWMANLFSLH